MPDNQKFVAARIRLNALCEHLPSFPSEKDVADYHSILKDIETNSSFDLSAFAIPDDQVAHQVVGAVRRSFSGRPGRVMYSSEKRCDRDYFGRQVLGAREYLNEMSKSTPPTSADSQDYWSKSDTELVALATAYGMACSYRPYLGGLDRSVALDRQKMIDQLLKRDQVLAGDHRGNVTVIFQGPVSGSTIQAASPHATASVSSGIDLTDLTNLIVKLKAEKPNLALSNSVSQQFDSNIQRLEREAQQPTPDRSVVLQCLYDTRQTFLAVGAGVASNAVWSALLHFLSAYH